MKLLPNDGYGRETTETFIALMEATFDVSPPAPELPTTSEARGLRRRPALAVAWGFLAVLIVVGGAIGISIIGSSGESVWAGPTGERPAVGIDAYWEWVAADATELRADVVGVTRLGPVPNFDPAEYGSTQQLTGEAEIAADWGLVIPDPEAKAPIAYIGATRNAGAHVFMYRIDAVSGEELLLCLQDAAGTTCTGSRDLGTGSRDDEPPVWIAWSDQAVSQPSIRIALAMLPKDASVVVLEFSDDRSFSQRPRGGVAAFEIPDSDLGSVASIAVLDADANEIWIQAVWSRVPHDEAVFGGDASQAIMTVTVGGPGLVAIGNDEADDGLAAVWVKAKED